MNGAGLRNVHRHLHTARAAPRNTKDGKVVRPPRVRRPGAPSLKVWLRRCAADDADELCNSARRWLSRKGATA